MYSKQLSRYVRVLSRMSRKQIIARIRRVVNQRLRYAFFSARRFPVDALCNFDITAFVDQVKRAQDADMWSAMRAAVNESDLINADQIVQGYFTFLNQSYTLDTSRHESWSLDPFDDKLWQYYLHYQEYLIVLLRAYAFTEKEHYADRIVELIDHWINCNPFWTRDAWEPYTTAKRLDSWSKVVPPLVVRGKLSQDFLKRLFASMTKQAQFLLENLEYDVDNNHLIADAKTLAIIGTIFSFLPLSSVWREKGYSLLWAEMDKQVHPEGSHYEHSASYHMVVLIDCLEAVLVAQKYGIAIPNTVLQKIEAMFSYLASMLLPSNETFLVNDSVENYPMRPKELLAVGTYLFQRTDWKSLCADADLGYLAWLCGAEGVSEFLEIQGNSLNDYDYAWTQSGYYVMRSGWSLSDTVILFDCGPLGPYHSCGHSHADALNFCLYTGGAMRITDSGVYEYKTGPWRSYFRSTAAHNTVIVDGENQSDVWHSFRVGRMAESVLTEWQSTDEAAVVEGYHDGYSRVGKRIIHRRRLEFHKPYELKIIDTLGGSSKHLVDAVFHFMPSEIRMLRDNLYVAEFDDGVALNLLFESIAPFTIDVSRSWISKHWKLKTLCPCITVSTRSALPLTLVTTVSIIAGGDN